MNREKEAYTRTMIAIIIIKILLLITTVKMIAGCGTIEGMRRDIHNLTAPTRAVDEQ